MIVDTRDSVFGGEQLFPSHGIWFEDITTNQPAYFVPRRGDASTRDREEIIPRPAVRRRLTGPETSQRHPRSGNTAHRHAQQPSHVPQSPMVVDRKRLTELYFTCPLCQKILTEPYVLTGCMHRFCRVCIESWFGLEKAKMCPTCGKEYNCTSNLSEYLCRDKMYEAMIKEIFACQIGEEPPSSRKVNDHVDDDLKIEKRVMTSSLSQGMSTYTRNALRNRTRRPLISLRAPTVIISLSFDHHTQNDWRYVACPLDKSIRQLKEVIAKHIHGSTSDNESLARSLRFHLMLDVRSFSERRRQDIADALCSDHNVGIDDGLTFRDILEVTGQPARRPNSYEYASFYWGSNEMTTHLDVPPVDSIDPHGQMRETPDLGGPGGRDISDRWPLFLQHVSKCTFAPGMCSHGETCDVIKSLGLHIRDCHVDQCTYPRCQPWKGLMRSHGTDCNNTSCLVCTLRKVGYHTRDQTPIIRRGPATMQESGQQHPGLGTAPMFRELGGTLKFHVSQGT